MFVMKCPRLSKFTLVFISYRWCKELYIHAPLSLHFVMFYQISVLPSILNGEIQISHSFLILHPSHIQYFSSLTLKLVAVFPFLPKYHELFLFFPSQLDMLLIYFSFKNWKCLMRLGGHRVINVGTHLTD